MKIAITGSFGTGKTTLANHVAEAKGFTLLPEVARVMAEEGYKLDKEITAEIEHEMFLRQVALECHQGPYISDRCLVDLLAYSAVLFENDFELLWTISRALRDAKYDVIIYLEPEFPIENDGVRSTDGEFQKIIDDRIKSILKGLNLTHHKVSGSREERLSQVLKIIEK